MYFRNVIGAVAQVAILPIVALLMSLGVALAFDASVYPDLGGQWSRAPVPGMTGEPGFDPSKPIGRAQQAPLKPEYQARFEASLKESEAGVPGTWPGPSCIAPGMPAQMTAYEPMEVVVLPRVTLIRIDYIRDSHRRIFTDGRAWPAHAEPSYDGYSIGKWIDEDRDGKFDVLEVETRNFKGPRAYDELGLPLHFDNQSVFKERFYRDKANPNIMHDILTTIDNALTRPWTVDKKYVRSPDPRPLWQEYDLMEANAQIMIGKENYFLSADGLLMPTKKNQAPPDTRYFTNTAK
jgi:hypothetical protein